MSIPRCERARAKLGCASGDAQYTGPGCASPDAQYTGPGYHRVLKLAGGPLGASTDLAGTAQIETPHPAGALQSAGQC